MSCDVLNKLENKMFILIFINLLIFSYKYFTVMLVHHNYYKLKLESF